MENEERIYKANVAMDVAKTLIKNENLIQISVPQYTKENPNPDIIILSNMENKSIVNLLLSSLSLMLKDTLIDKEVDKG